MKLEVSPVCLAFPAEGILNTLEMCSQSSSELSPKDPEVLNQPGKLLSALQVIQDNIWTDAQNTPQVSIRGRNGHFHQMIWNHQWGGAGCRLWNSFYNRWDPGCCFWPHFASAATSLQQLHSSVCDQGGSSGPLLTFLEQDQARSTTLVTPPAIFSCPSLVQCI